MKVIISVEVLGIVKIDHPFHQDIVSLPTFALEQPLSHLESQCIVIAFCLSMVLIFALASSTRTVPSLMRLSSHEKLTNKIFLVGR